MEIMSQAAVPNPQSKASNSPAQTQVSTAEDTKLRTVCRQFEGQFFDMMLQEMRKTVPDDTLLGDDDHQQQIFQSMMDDHLSQDMASRSGGPNDLAEQLYTQLRREYGDRASAAASSASRAAAGNLVEMPGEPADNSAELP